MKRKKHVAQKAILLMAFVAVFGRVGAQDYYYHKEFAFGEETTTSSFTGNDDYENDWVFSNCYAIQNGNLQVGGGGSGGYVITPAFPGFNDAAMVTIEVHNSNSGSKTVSLSIDGADGCWLSAPTQNIPAKSNANLSTLLRLNGATSPKLKMEISSPSFDLKAVTVTNVDNILMYESFSNISGTNGVTSFNIVSSSLSDSSNPSFDNKGSEQRGCRAGEACIYIHSIEDNNQYFTTAVPQSAPSGKVLLRFRAAGAKTTSAVSVNLAGSSGESFSTSSFTPAKEVWTQYEVVVDGYTNNSQITFTGSRVFLDDILITEEPTITLSETDTDDSKISFNNGGLRTVQLTRTLGADYWNTLCLPFDVTKTKLEEAFGYGADPVINTLESVDGGIFNFTSAENVAAGTPFLLKVKKQVVNPTFTEVEISQATPKTVSPNNDGYSFVGTYSTHTLLTDNTQLFLGTDGNLYLPAAGQNVMNGLRAYFTVPSGAPVRVVADESENELGVGRVTASPGGHIIIYNMMGQPCQGGSLKRGMYIVNGKKTIIR